MRLTATDRSTIQDYIDFAVLRLAEQGLHLEIDRDMAAFKAFYNAQPGRHDFPTYLDAEHSVLPPDSYWIKVVSADGQIVACHGQKRFETSARTCPLPG